MSSYMIEYTKNVLKFQTFFSFCSRKISNKMLVIRTGIHKMLVRRAYREDPDQTASAWVCAACHGLFGRQLESQILEYLLYQELYNLLHKLDSKRYYN